MNQLIFREVKTKTNFTNTKKRSNQLLKALQIPPKFSLELHDK